MRKELLAICLLATACLSGCTTLIAQPSKLHISKATRGTPPERGLKVTKVFPNSPASAADIHVMDLITQYGEFPIADDAGFFAAKNHYDQPFQRTVEIVVWRGPLRMTARVRTGWLGVSSTSNDKVSQEFAKLMTRIETMRKIPNYMHEREFKGQFTETEAAVLQKAKELIDRAEREGTMTSGQVLFSRIYMILDDAPEEDQRRQAQLLKQLIETQPENYIHMLGSDIFFEHERYRAAIVCFKHHLKTSPHDLSIRLNLAYAYNQVGMYENARIAVDDVLDDNLQLNQYAYGVAYQAKAIASLGLKDYVNCIQFAEKVYATRHHVYELMVIQLAAAQTRDTQRLERVVQELERTNPDEYLKMKLQLDAVEAYARVKNNERDVARKLVRTWKDDYRSEERVLRYWREFPGGTDVAKNWSELTKRS